jgi:glycosyltransferase involved in cell wall biosynthesis
VISTPYWHAAELLGGGAGILVPFRAPEAIARAILDLMDDEGKRKAMRQMSYLSGREMIWPEVAKAYMRSFERACREGGNGRRQRSSATGMVDGGADNHPS